jgi:hypothetical protein
MHFVHLASLSARAQGFVDPSWRRAGSWPCMTGVWRIALLCDSDNDMAHSGVVMWHEQLIGSTFADAAAVIRNFAEPDPQDWEDQVDRGFVSLAKYSEEFEREFDDVPETDRRDVTSAINGGDGVGMMPAELYCEKLMPLLQQQADLLSIARPYCNHIDPAMREAGKSRWGQVSVGSEDGVTLLGCEGTALGAMGSTQEASRPAMVVWEHIDDAGQRVGAKFFLHHGIDEDEHFDNHFVGDVRIGTEDDGDSDFVDDDDDADDEELDRNDPDDMVEELEADGTIHDVAEEP